MTLHLKQRTLARPVSCTGVGVHSGREVSLAIRPAPVNHGIRFIRTDLLNSPSISALFNMVVDTSLATVIGYDGFIVSTIEHLMASFYGLSIDNALVEINDYEVPIMDGSAAPFAAMIREAGVVEQDAPRFFFVINSPIELSENGKSVGLYPDETTRISYQIEFDHPLIQKQALSFSVTEDYFETQISKARTFGFLKEYELLKQYGLGRGASLDNTVVMDEGRRFEPIRPAVCR